MPSKVVVNNYGSFDVTFKKGKGSTLVDVNGKKYIDFLAGIAVNCLGHNFRPLVKAISKQAAKEIHICNYFLSDTGVAYANELLAATGFDGVTTTTVCSSSTVVQKLTKLQLNWHVSLVSLTVAQNARQL